jgi:hypothetical protein
MIPSDAMVEAVWQADERRLKASRVRQGSFFPDSIAGPLALRALDSDGKPRAGPGFVVRHREPQPM